MSLFVKQQISDRIENLRKICVEENTILSEDSIEKFWDFINISKIDKKPIITVVPSGSIRSTWKMGDIKLSISFDEKVKIVHKDIMGSWHEVQMDYCTLLELTHLPHMR